MMDVKWLAGTALLLLATPAFAGTTLEGISLAIGIVLSIS